MKDSIFLPLSTVRSGPLQRPSRSALFQQVCVFTCDSLQSIRAETAVVFYLRQLIKHTSRDTCGVLPATAYRACEPRQLWCEFSTSSSWPRRSSSHNRILENRNLRCCEPSSPEKNDVSCQNINMKKVHFISRNIFDL